MAATGTTASAEKGRRIVGVERQTLAKDLVKRYTSGESIRALASALTLAEQAERRRIADLLHEDVQQLLLGAQLQLRQIARDEPDEAEGIVADVDAILRKALHATRELAV